MKKINKMNKMNKHILAVLAAGIAALIIGFGSCDTGANPAVEDAKETLRGTVAITGTAKVGETLTANISGVTNGTGTAAYQWKRGNDVIDGAAGGTYVLADADNGKTITLVVSFSGNNGSLTSAPTAAVQPKDQAKETLQGTVAITGTAQVGETLTADLSGVTNGTGAAAYQWKRGNDVIAGASGGTYVLADADEGKTITLVVSFSGNNGNLTSAATAAVQAKEALQGTVSITGTAKVGETLTADISGITNGTGATAYQWKRDGQNIAGATNGTYLLTSADNGAAITLAVSFSGNSGSVVSAATATVTEDQQGKDALQGTVSITGTAKVGETLTAYVSGITNGTGTVAYQWKRGNSVIAGETGDTYLLTGADTGETITVTVSFSGNTGSITSNPTAAVQGNQSAKEALQGTVAITGTAKVGETLTADISGITNGTGTATYQWKRDGQNIAAATNGTYLLASADNGAIITLVVSFSGNTGSLVSNPTATVQPKDQAKEALQGTVAITGTAKVGETLTADISGITNGTGAAAYQWKRDGQNIAAATNGTYLLASADNGAIITLVVSFSGNTGSITSAPTAAVQPAKEALQGTVAINGTAKVGETLVADITGITNCTGSVSYQWKRSGQNIAGATGGTYLLTGTDKGATITITVSFSGNTGSLTSNPTSAVASSQILYGKIDNVFNVFQDDGVSDAQMATSFENLKDGYDLLVNYYKKNEGVTDPLLGKITEIHIIADKYYTWDDNTKILGVKQGMPSGNYGGVFDEVYKGTIPPMAQLHKSARETVRMARLPQDGAAIARERRGVRHQISG